MLLLLCLPGLAACRRGESQAATREAGAAPASSSAPVPASSSTLEPAPTAATASGESDAGARVHWRVVESKAPEGARVLVDGRGPSPSPHDREVTTLAAERKRALDAVSSRFDENLDPSDGSKKAAGLTIIGAWQGAFLRDATKTQRLLQIASIATAPGGSAPLVSRGRTLLALSVNDAIVATTVASEVIGIDDYDGDGIDEVVVGSPSPPGGFEGVMQRQVDIFRFAPPEVDSVVPSLTTFVDDCRSFQPRASETARLLLAKTPQPTVFREVVQRQACHRK